MLRRHLRPEASVDEQNQRQKQQMGLFVLWGVFGGGFLGGGGGGVVGGVGASALRAHRLHTRETRNIPLKHTSKTPRNIP